MDERIQLESAEDRAVEFIPLIVGSDINAAMNVINTDPEARRKAEEKRRQQLERREQERLRQEAESHPGQSQSA